MNVASSAATRSQRTFRADTLMASFVVALVASFLIALAMLLLKTISLPVLRLDARLFADVTINILILFFLGFFVLIRGSIFAAWLLYRHDVAWGYHVERKKMAPIFITALLMSGAIYGAVYLFASGEIQKLVYLEDGLKTLQRARTL